MVQPSLPIANELGQLLISTKLFLSTAESCTGGLVASTLCSAQDTPLFYAGGYVAFNNRAKKRMLGVNAETLRKHTAVSSQVVQEMARGARTLSGADISLAISGYAGPEGGDDGTPAGTVWFAWQISDQETRVKSVHFSGDAQSVIRQAADYALAGVLLLIGQTNEK